jgi:hypothetical protein
MNVIRYEYVVIREVITLDDYNLVLIPHQVYAMPYT